MRNKCKHENPQILMEHNFFGYRIYWCDYCGATKYSFRWFSNWEKGKWKSPKMAKNRT